jgi:hypothetical protein
MSKFKSRGGILFLVMLFIAGCSKSSNTATGNNSTAPTLKSPTFVGPSSTSSTADTSLGYQVATSTASLFNVTAQSYLRFYTGNGMQSGNSWTWTYSAQGFTAIWTATSSPNGYKWTLVYNGTLGNITYNKWTALSGTESTDGKTGSWTIYYPNTAIVGYQVNWSTDISGVVSGTIVGNDSTGTLNAKYVFTNNPDKSGELVIYDHTAKTFDIKWTSSGSGSYTEWDDQGKIVATGNWT